ncbi:MAG: redoxin domain-containing protein [Saprospiraceae bacterium]|nr:redoxin domain-containing protein [Saprospiraceae bacterium]
MQAPSFWNEMVSVKTGETLTEMADNQPVMLVFLRFFGCSFCREAISDVAKRRLFFENKGFRVVFVHMAPDLAIADKFFKKYKLYPVDHISDPEKRFYQLFGLGRGTPQQLFGLMNWIRGFQATVLEGHGAELETPDLGDGFQMPGVFVLHKGETIRSFIHRYAHDRPDYEEICQI